MIDLNEAQPDGKEPLPPEVIQAATVMGDYFSKRGLRFWDVGLTCSRIYSMCVQLCGNNLKKLHGEHGDGSIDRHNAAVSVMRKLVDMQADKEFFDALKRLDKKPGKLILPPPKE